MINITKSSVLTLISL